MSCSTWREHLSADLDGEADPHRLDAAYAHLADCADCAGWFADAALVNRLVRTSTAEPAPGLSAEQLTEALRHLPRARRVPPWHRVGRWALGAVGAAQAVLGLVALTIPGGDGMADGASLMGADLAHMSHESSAWNLALGVAFLAGAVWTRHLAGVLPVLGSFVLVLSLVSAVDLVSGNVDVGRVASHALVAVGFGLIVAIVTNTPSLPRSGPALALPTGGAEQVAGLHVAGSIGPAADGPTGPSPAARHRAA